MPDKVEAFSEYMNFTIQLKENIWTANKRYQFTPAFNKAYNSCMTFLNISFKSNINITVEHYWNKIMFFSGPSCNILLLSTTLKSQSPPISKLSLTWLHLSNSTVYILGQYTNPLSISIWFLKYRVSLNFFSILKYQV